MMYFLRAGGLFSWLIVVLALVNAGLAVGAVQRLARGGPDSGDAARTADTILFWGAICAVLGVLGQYTGIYKGLSVIVAATEIDPHVVAQGFVESFITTLEGLTVLAASAVVWFVLKAWVRRAAGAGRKEAA